MSLLERKNWKLRIVRTIRSEHQGVIRYPFSNPLFSVETYSRKARSSWIRAGYLDTVVRVSGSSSIQTVQTTFIRLFDQQWVWVPDGISSYWLKVRPVKWVTDLSVTIREFVGDTSTDEFAALKGQLDRVEIKVDRLIQ